MGDKSRPPRTLMGTIGFGRLHFSFLSTKKGFTTTNGPSIRKHVEWKDRERMLTLNLKRHFCRKDLQLLLTKIDVCLNSKSENLIS